MNSKTVVIATLGTLFGGSLLLCSGCLCLGVLGTTVSSPTPRKTLPSTPPIVRDTADTAVPKKTDAKLSQPTFSRRGEIITAEEYARLETGMTRDQVARIIGAHGEEVSSSNIADIKTIMLMWKNSNGSNANAIFQNGSMVSKAQFGLPSRPGSEAHEDGELPVFD